MPQTPLSKETCTNIRALLASGKKHREVADALNVSKGSVYDHGTPGRCKHDREPVAPQIDVAAKTVRRVVEWNNPELTRPIFPDHDTRILVWPDTHVPHDHDERALNMALNLMRWWEPEIIVVLGDLIDCRPVSHWLKDQRKTSESLRLSDDFDAGNELLDELQSNCDRLIYLEGNHEAWLRQAIERMPSLDGVINLHIGLRFADRGQNFEFYPYGKLAQIGHAYFTHGKSTVDAHAKKMVTDYGLCIFYGHTHTVQSYYKVSPVDVTDAKVGMSMGCLASKNPEFLKNQPNRYVHCIGPGVIRAGGMFNIDPVIITRGEASYGGYSFSHRD